MIVAELMKKLKTMLPNARVIHINYRWYRKNAYSDPEVFLNLEGSCSIGAKVVGLITCKENKNE